MVLLSDKHPIDLTIGQELPPTFHYAWVILYGTPDIVFRSAKVVVFADSCFWHRCRYHCRRPKSNIGFWNDKLARNRKRDANVNRHYRQRGWLVIRFWEHRLNRDHDACVEEVLLGLKRARNGWLR